MSLVGTRPPTLDEWEKYELHHRARLAIKPGITGMWQVSGRSEITDLHYFDLLISDYSSVITDFACSGKPVVFFPYDLEKYNQDECGLLSCFFEKKLGPFGYTWEEVLSHVFRLLQDDTWKEERIRVLKEYHSFTDGKNRERVYKTVCKLIEQGE